MKNPKIKSLDQLKTIVEKLKKQRKKIVFTNGCFDIVHAGHAELFRKAKSLGDVLIVGVNSDSSVKTIKSNVRPIITEKYRMELLSAIQYIDYVVKYDESTPLKVIQALFPHIVVKGGDWAADKVVGRGYADVVRVKLVSGLSTTDMIKRIKNL